MQFKQRQSSYLNQQGLSKAHPASERRVVSILYADIVSSSKIIAGLDPDDIPDFLDPAIDKMIRAVHAFGGKIMRVQGDGIKAIFGATSSVEHHALLAAYAGQEILSLMKSELPSAHIPRAEVRVGIHSGFVIVRWQQNDFGGGLDTVGTVAHIAAKIEQTGRKGYVTISETTAGLIGEYAQLEKVDFQASKAITEAGQLYRISSMEAASDTEHKSVGRAHIPIYGRERELTELITFLERPESETKNTLSIVGPAGIGKTRLLREIATWAYQKNFRVENAGGIVVFKDSPFFLVRKLLKRLLGLNVDAVSLQKTGVLLQDLRLDPNQITSFANLLSSDRQTWVDWDLPTDEKIKAIQTGMVVLLQNICMHDPLILLVEDLHDADSESLQILEYLSLNCTDISLSIIVTMRPEGIEVLEWDTASRLSLNSLSQKASYSLAEAYCDADVAKKNPDLIQGILERCVGNPLALLEFSKISGNAKLENGAPILPLTLEPLLRQRLDALSKEEKNLVEHASVLGVEFNIKDLRACVGLNTEVIELAIDSVIDRKLFFYKGNDSLAFEHHLFQEVAYKSLLRERRREIHAKTYDALKCGQIYEPQILAHHAAESDQSELALKHLWQACDSAIAQSAARTVRNLYYRAAILCERLGPSGEYRKLQFALKTFDAFHQLTWEREHLDVYEMALEKLISQLMPEETALITCNLAVIQWIGGTAVKANETARRAYDIALQLNYFPMICYAEFILANTEYSTGQVRQAVSRLKATALQFKTEKRATRFGQTIILPSVMYRAFASWYCVDLGELEEAQELWATANKIAVIENHEYSKAICGMALGYHEYRTGEYENAANILTKVYKSCLENSYLGVAPMVAGWACLSYLDCNNLAAAEKILNQELSSGRIDRVKNSCKYYVIAAKARLLSVQGDIASAGTWFERALETARLSRDKVHQAYAHFEIGRHNEFALQENLAAIEQYQIALKLSHETEMKTLEAMCLHRIGTLK